MSEVKVATVYWYDQCYGFSSQTTITEIGGKLFNRVFILPISHICDICGKWHWHTLDQGEKNENGD